MSSEVEKSLIVNSKRFLDFARNDKKALVTILIILASTSPALAQESATPAVAPESPTRNVRITFVPPPLGGEISLGIYDDDGKLVRVLKQEAALNEFEVGDDGLSTQWDGKDDNGFDMPGGTYHARGYVVAPMKIEQVPVGGTVLGPPSLETPLRVRLVRNPLEKTETPVVDLDVGYDDENAYLKTSDGLPLITISSIGDVEHAAVVNRSDQTFTILLRTPATSVLVKVSPISNMMSFNCGDFELK